MVRRWGVVIGGVCAAAVVSAGVMTAGPVGAEPKSPYPDISHYAKLYFEAFRLADKPGLWFSAPFGLDCGIWDDGSFGCTGPIAGAPAGTNQVGWFSGDSQAHFDSTGQLRFSSGGAQRVLPANNYLEYAGTKCATTPDNSVYCTRNSIEQFMVSASKTWLNSTG